MGNSEIEKIEREIKDAKEFVDFGAAVERLRGNPDFRKVFLQGYFEREAIRLVHLKSDPAAQSADTQRGILASIDAIGACSAYLTHSVQKASIASKQVAAGEEALEEMAAEGGAV